MNLLLDTHILLWTLTDDFRLVPRARMLIDYPDNMVFFSIVSIWEIEIKRLAHPDKMSFSADDVISYCKESGFHLIPIKIGHVLKLRELGRNPNAPPHKDPFDRIMICQALAENMLFLTHDHLLSDYNVSCVLTV